MHDERGLPVLTSLNLHRPRREHEFAHVFDSLSCAEGIEEALKVWHSVFISVSLDGKKKPSRHGPHVLSVDWHGERLKVEHNGAEEQSIWFSP